MSPTKRPPPKPQRQPPEYTAQQAVALIHERIREGEELAATLPSRDAMEQWSLLTREVLKRSFGEGSDHIGSIMSAGPNAVIISRDISERELAEKRSQRLSAIIGQLRQAIRILELPMAEPMARSTAAVQPTPATAPHSEKRIFLVHGRDDAAKYAVRSFIEQHVVDHKVTILHEQANEGHTIIEKFEKHAAAAFAVVLLTPDDVGGLAGEPLEKQRPRARQNVIFELGYFIARLGRARVCALCTEGVEAPSDFAGVVYVPLDAHDGWHLKLLRELKSAGFAVRL